MKKTLLLLLILSTAFIFAQPAIIPNSAPQVNLDEILQRKIVSHKLVADVRQGLLNNINRPDALIEEEKVGVVIYFDDYPTNNEISELEALGINCFVNTWIPPLENHQYGFILAKLPPSQLNNALSKSFIKKMDSSTHEAYPNNNLGTVAMGADMVWGAGFDGTGVKVAVLDSGLDPFYEGTDLPTGYERLDCWQYPITDPIVDNQVSGHGTHVTGSVLGRGALSAGNTGNGGGAYKGSAPGADLVFLKIGGDASSSTSSAAMIGAMQEAVNTFNADILSMSYGGWYDHHDGSSATEQTVDWVYSMGKPFFISAGNSADDDRHYSGTVAAGGETGFIQVNVTNAGVNNTALFFNLVWFDGSANNNLSLKYYDASMTELTSIINSGTVESTRGTESNFSNYQYYTASGNSTYFLKVINPSGEDQFFHIYDRWGARVTFNSPDPFYTIGQPASADHACAVGAYTTRSSWIDYAGNGPWSFGYTLNAIAPFSSRGPRIDEVMMPEIIKPEITAPGSMILSLRDTDAPETTTDNVFTIDNDGNTVGDKNYYAMNGTSMACPLAAGAAALYLQYNPGATPQDVYDALQINAISDAFTGAVPNSTFGHGKLNIYNAISSELFVDIIVFLEGAYDDISDEMSTTLNPDDIPLDQPFSGAPWNYLVKESVSEIPVDVTDWVLVELRTDENTLYTRKAAFVKNDGTVVNLNGSPFTIQGQGGDYFIVVHHRNHLSIMSAAKVTLTNNIPTPLAVPQVELKSDNQVQLIDLENEFSTNSIRR